MDFNFFLSNLEFCIFVLILGFFLFFKRKNVEISGFFPIFYMMLYKTRLGLDKMSIWSKKYPKVFLYLSYFCVFVGVVGCFFGFFFMIWQLNFIFEQNIEQGAALVLPIKTDNGKIGGIPNIAPPFFYWLIAFFVLAIVHEFAHGVIARRFDIKIKSSGFAFLSILAPLIPAAFVEPDQKQIAKKSWFKQVSVFGAGSASNFLFGFLFLFIWFFIALPIFNSTMVVDNIEFLGVNNHSDLKEYNLSSGQILSINNKKSDLMLNQIKNLSFNQSLNLEILNLQNNQIKNYKIKTYFDKNSNSSFIGINNLNVNYKSKYFLVSNLPIYFERSLFWLWFLNLGIGFMNLVPLWITDGGQILRVSCTKFFKSYKFAMFFYNLICFTTFIVLIFSIFPNLLRSLF